MSFDTDDEILQDFLIEAGEILEDMSEQLVALENEPESTELLNGIFRGFHTIKGGAGFLSLNPLVEICHITENIFDLLRNGKRLVDADLMDSILKALDILNDMFDEIKNGETPQNADPEFIKELDSYTSGGGAPQVEEVTPPPIEIQPEAPADASESPSEGEDITDEEFDALMDELHGEGQFSPDVDSNDEAASVDITDNADATDNGDITDAEFDALMDELHGEGKFSNEVSAAKKENTKKEGGEKSQADHSKNNDKASDDDITDDEFDALMDELHGAGKGPASDSNQDKPNKKQEKEKKQPVKPSNKKALSTKPKLNAKDKDAGKKNKPVVVTEATVRVDTKRLDDIMNMVGELVLARNRLKTLGQDNPDEKLTKAISNLDIITGDLQGAVMKTRMQPIKKVFGRFPRVVRDLARTLNKEITLELVGEETDLDKNLVEALADPLVHLVRNSVDHGIEMPDDRVAAGKERCGKIILSAVQEGDHISLSIEDDGKGMDPDILRNIAIDKGLMDKEQAEKLTDEECFNLIFMAGFSTKEAISDISGRGVGMDVVKTKIAQLNGLLSIDSTLGKGTKLLIQVPLTLAILPTLMVKIKQQSFALPLSSVNEIFNLDLAKTNVIDGKLVVIVREKAIPLFFLNEWLSHASSSNEKQQEGHVVLVQMGTKRVGFVVDSLVGQEEIVIKPLGKSLQGTPGMAGATITSNGGIALIIDIPSLLKHYAR